MPILKLKPACKDYLWGGHRLVEEYGVEYDGEILAEAWTLSTHPAGASMIANGKYAGKTLTEYINIEGFEILGTHCRRFREFPILIKFIDAKNSLSIQVHPSNAYALKNEGQYGKTEFWYVLDAEPDAFLYYGFNRNITRAEFVQRINDNTLLEVLNAVPVKKGDTFLINSGTLHAIGKGILLAEIQQNSNVTYRIYDYGRVGADGKQRELHIDKALDVTNLNPIVQTAESYPHVADCDYFTVDKINLDGKLTYRVQGNVTDESFLSILILDGNGTISNKDDKLSYSKGDSFFLPANSGYWQIEGTCDAILTTIREKINPIRVGVNIGTSEIQIGVVDELNKIIAAKNLPTNHKRPAREIIDETAENILKLLAENDIPLEQCVGVGVGIPGTIDRRKGKVIYSNNIRWENVPLRDWLGEVIPCPVRIANDADCAALGEAIAGAGKNFSEVVMFTLGGGVGGGIILNGEVFEGGMIGGSEVGHQVIRVNGRQCSCGRRGCLEAYVSIPALIKEASKVVGKDLTLDEIFNNPELNGIVEHYTQILGQGIVNIVNMFRPQLILIGGAISAYAENLIEPLTDILRKNCFGGEHSQIPKIAIAKLGNNAGIIGAVNL